MLAQKDPYIESAYQKLQVISQDRDKRLEQEAREKAIRDYNESILEVEERGEKRGEERGEKRAEERMKRLQTALLRDGRFDDLKRSIEDRNFERQLMEDYGILPG